MVDEQTSDRLRKQLPRVTANLVGSLSSLLLVIELSDDLAGARSLDVTQRARAALGAFNAWVQAAAESGELLDLAVREDAEMR